MADNDILPSVLKLVLEPELVQSRTYSNPLCWSINTNKYIRKLYMKTINTELFTIKNLKN